MLDPIELGLFAHTWGPVEEKSSADQNSIAVYTRFFESIGQRKALELAKQQVAKEKQGKFSGGAFVKDNTLYKFRLSAEKDRVIVLKVVSKNTLQEHQ